MAASWQAAGSLAAPRRASHRTAMAQRSRAQPLPKVSPPGPPRGFMDPPAVSASPLIAGHLPKASHQRSMMFTIGTRSNSESAAEFPVRPTMRQKGTPNTQIHRSRMIQCQMLNAPFRSPRWLVGALPMPSDSIDPVVPRPRPGVRAASTRPMRESHSHWPKRWGFTSTHPRQRKHA